MGELLRLEAVGKSYRRGERRLRVLADVSLTVAAGEVVTVVGSRYEGKTTLLKIAAGLEQPDTGTVWFADRDLGRLPARERERLWGDEIAWVDREGPGVQFQVLDYVGVPLRIGRHRRDADELAMAALERVGAPDVARLRWPDLSNWERVLVALARGIVGEPSLMVVDDVIDGLGVSKTQEAGELLCSLGRELGCGVLMSVSDVEASLIADRVWFFEDGALKLAAGSDGGQADVIDFPQGVSRSQGSSGLGS